MSYSITSGNSDGVFSIANAAVGNITTVKAMDREATPDSPAYTLTVFSLIPSLLSMSVLYLLLIRL